MALSRTVPRPDNTALAQLAGIAKERRAKNLSYAGDVTPQEAFDYCRGQHALLVDVRTVPEWQFTGVPDLTETRSKLLTISWKLYPDFTLNPKFADQLAVETNGKDTPLFFMCRSGGRSLDAAVAMAAAEYEYCFNIAGGFEGEPDAQGHRGRTQGWKAARLSWKQG